ncbi:hypothetical protein H4Q26_007008 [Puccinia striiformis f. sp. tritici PST-130]|nr:hypothetical protein H4Q26_007008 [Puccinia striiformis f. sp. tritici PST-130]
MASSLQALSNAIKNATTREQPARSVKDLEEEEEESEKEGNVLTSTAIEIKLGHTPKLDDRHSPASELGYYPAR